MLATVRIRRSVVAATAVCCLLAACHREPAANAVPPIVGTWLVQMPEAPFPFHLFAFHADGTVQQSNPDAGDPNTSDSSAMGAWQLQGDTVTGRIVEVTADRATRRFVSRGEIAFILHVHDDDLRGTATAAFYDVENHPQGGPILATVTGRRVRP